MIVQLFCRHISRESPFQSQRVEQVRVQNRASQKQRERGNRLMSTVRVLMETNTGRNGSGEKVIALVMSFTISVIKNTWCNNSQLLDGYQSILEVLFVSSCHIGVFCLFICCHYIYLCYGLSPSVGYISVL